MSADEDTELRDLVAQALESNGVLGKIKAQLRASVFLALEEQESIHNKTPLQNEELKKYLATKDGKLAASLVREFLQFFHLDFTLAVFDPESGLNADVYESRSSLAKDLGIKELDAQPLIGALMKKKVAETGRVSNEGESAFSFAAFNENKNRINETHNKPAPKSPTESRHSSVDHEDKKDDDSFFDDPFPNSSEHSKSFSSDKSRDKKDQKSTNQPKPGGFLSGAPPLNGTDKGLKNVDQDKELKTIDKNLADLGFDVPEDDYDDDFESNNVSPVIQTPRSARSDHNIKSLEEETDQEIEEQLSVTEDLLKSDNSGADDLTTDRTVSPTDLSTAFDYAEEIHLP